MSESCRHRLFKEACTNIDIAGHQGVTNKFDKLRHQWEDIPMAYIMNPSS